MDDNRVVARQELVLKLDSESVLLKTSMRSESIEKHLEGNQSNTVHGVIRSFY